MDRGAARSRKRSKQVDPSEPGQTFWAPRPSSDKPNGIRPPVQAGPSRESHGSEARQHHKSKAGLSSRPEHAHQSRFRGAPPQSNSHKGEQSHRRRSRNEEREEQSRDPALYRPKAIRDSTALIYSSAPFEIPPSLRNVTRLDLEGSGVTDVSWLKRSGVTWLSLKGCVVESGWDAVGSLEGLTVLNISECQLDSLPPALGHLGKLKALVGMNNPWTALDDEVVSHWTQLNSLIISHSPHLTKLPSALGSLFHLSKLTFSHCPGLATDGILDLSSLPLLRDVKMNNLPLLDSLPPHLPAWGKGPMSSIENSRSADKVRDDAPRTGAGLQSLDVGNCALSYDTVSSTFLAPNTPFANLRSLTLHGNPFCDSRPDYVQRLSGSSNFPRLQVVDNKRVKEKVKRESKEEIKARQRVERKMKPSGSNEASAVMRKWGGEGPGDGTDVAEPKRATMLREGEQGNKASSGLKRKRKRPEQEIGGDGADRAPRTVKAVPTVDVPPRAKKPRAHDQHSKLIDKPPKATPTADTSHQSADPSARQAPKPNTKPSKSQTSVVGIVDVIPARLERSTKDKQGKRKGDSSKVKATATGQLGLDLREMFGKQDDAGLGVGSW